MWRWERVDGWWWRDEKVEGGVVYSARWVAI